MDESESDEFRTPPSSPTELSVLDISHLDPCIKSSDSYSEAELVKSLHASNVLSSADSAVVQTGCILTIPSDCFSQSSSENDSCPAGCDSAPKKRIHTLDVKLPISAGQDKCVQVDDAIRDSKTQVTDPGVLPKGKQNCTDRGQDNKHSEDKHLEPCTSKSDRPLLKLEGKISSNGGSAVKTLKKRTREKIHRHQSQNTKKDQNLSDYASSSGSPEKSCSDSELSSDSDSRQAGNCIGLIKDPNAFVSISTLQESAGENSNGIQVKASLLGVQSEEARFYPKKSRSCKDQIDSSNLNTYTPDLFAVKLLKAEKACDLAVIAMCLQAPFPYAIERTLRSLERMLINSLHLQSASRDVASVQSSPTKLQDFLTILRVLVRQINRHSHPDKNCFRRERNAMLLVACFLLCCPERGSELIQQQLVSMRSEIDSGKVMASIRSMFDDIHHSVTSKVTHHQEDWELFLKGIPRDKKNLSQEKSSLQEANVVQRAQRCFSLMKAMVATVGWDSLIQKLLFEVQRVVKHVHKHEKSSSSRSLFYTFIVRGFSVILSTKFKEDRKAMDKHECNPPKLIAELLQSVLRSVQDSDHKQMLVEEACELLAHASRDIRKAVLDAIDPQRRPVSEMLLASVEGHLQITGFRLQDDIAASLGGRKRNCTWQEIGWREPHKQPLHGVIFIPCRKCLEIGSSRQCLLSESSRQIHRQRMQHLQRLLELGQHPNLLSLWAYQCQPFPTFYITESVREKLLFTLINDRNCLNSSLGYQVLLEAADQVLSVIDFLAGKGIALRDLTTSNMTCLIKDSNGRKQIKVKVANMALSHEYLTQTKSIRLWRDPGPCPLLWLSPEALFSGRFSDRSMIYAFGYVLHELFTRGCQPFTEMSRPIDDIIRLLFLHSPSVRAFEWPCIPDRTFALIRHCTRFKSEKRPSLEQLQQTMKELRSAQVPNAVKEIRTFPQININQEARNYMPLTTMPQIIHSLTGDPNRYKNLKLSSWRTSPGVKVTDTEQIALDSISIEPLTPPHATEVKERLTPNFTDHILPDLECCILPNVVCWIDDPALIFGYEGYYLQTRRYECSETLLEVAKRSLVRPDTYQNDSTCPELIFLCLQLACALQSLHQYNWLHCDLRSKNVLISPTSKQVILARIGRMVNIGSSSSFYGQHFKDSVRWAAPEVLHTKVYSKKSDIFSLVTTFWEIFHIAHTCSDVSLPVDDFNLFPLANVEIDGVADIVQEGVLLPQVPGSPDWMYDLICDGRNPDRAARPDIEQLVAEIRKNWLPLEQLTLESKNTQLSPSSVKLPSRTREVPFLRRQLSNVLSHLGWRKIIGPKHTQSMPILDRITQTNGDPGSRIVQKPQPKRKKPAQSKLQAKGDFYAIGYISNDRFESATVNEKEAVYPDNVYEDPDVTQCLLDDEEIYENIDACASETKTNVHWFPRERKTHQSRPLPPTPCASEANSTQVIGEINRELIPENHDTSATSGCDALEDKFQCADLQQPDAVVTSLSSDNAEVVQSPATQKVKDVDRQNAYCNEHALTPLLGNTGRRYVNVDVINHRVPRHHFESQERLRAENVKLKACEENYYEPVGKPNLPS